MPSRDGAVYNAKSRQGRQYQVSERPEYVRRTPTATENDVPTIHESNRMNREMIRSPIPDVSLNTLPDKKNNSKKEC